MKRSFVFVRKIWSCCYRRPIQFFVCSFLNLVRVVDLVLKILPTLLMLLSCCPSLKFSRHWIIPWESISLISTILMIYESPWCITLFSITWLIPKFWYCVQRELEAWQFKNFLRSCTRCLIGWQTWRLSIFQSRAKKKKFHLLIHQENHCNQPQGILQMLTALSSIFKQLNWV